jgi:hypothetical protein
VLVAIALIGGLILLISGGSDGGDARSGSDGTPQISATPRDSPQISELQNRFLNRTVADRDKGISVRSPGNWKVKKKGGVTTIESKGGCLVMQLSAPVPADKAKALRKDGIGVLRSRYRNVKLRRAPRSKLGGIPTRSVRITITGRKGNHLQALLSVGTGKKHAYLTEVVVRNPACQRDLQLAQLMVGTVEFTK